MRALPFMAACTVTALLFALGTAERAVAQDKFPSRPIEVILPVPPGGGSDIAVRELAGMVEASLGQKLVLVNKPGGAGAIGTTALLQAKPDGYTIGAVWNAPL